MSNNYNHNNINSFGDLNNSELFYINILNTIYNDNLRIINQLLEQNSEITHTLINFMNNRRTRAASYENLNQPQNNNVHNNNSSNNSNPNDRRIFIDNIPYYIVDEVQFFTIPPTNSNSANNSDTINDQPRRSHINRNRVFNRHRRPATNRDDLEPIEPTRFGRGIGTILNEEYSRIINNFLQPISIVPTQAQIENATSNVIYRDIVNPINTSCPISLETFTDTSRVTMIKHCRHIFNSNNLMSWFNSNCKCPVCRYDIRNYIENNNNDEGNITGDNSRNDDNDDGENDQDNNANNDDNDDNLNSDENNNRENNNRENNNNSNINGINNGSTNNITQRASSILENLFYDTLHDLSNNNIQYQYAFDESSPLFTLLFQNGRYYNSNTRR